MAKLKYEPIEESEGKLPICPQCEKEIETVRYFQQKVDWKLSCLFVCPHCLKVLGIGTVQ